MSKTVKQDHVEIIAAANGYMVRLGRDYGNDCVGETHVFETFDHLIAHLRDRLPAMEA